MLERRSIETVVAIGLKSSGPPCIHGDDMTVFGPFNKNKALCSCGSIADLDAKMVTTKRRLGKRVECAACRNKRIAREHEDLERHFLGLDDEEC